MIVRGWQAKATRDNAPRYRSHLEGAVFPQLKQLDGFQGAELLEATDGEDVEILVLTRWRDMDAVRSFAGDEPDLAVVEPAAQAVLSRYAERVRHFELVSELRA
jgi:heme-degrading monooxygenase HmoA